MSFTDGSPSPVEEKGKAEGQDMPGQSEEVKATSMNERRASSQVGASERPARAVGESWVLSKAKRSASITKQYCE